MNRELKYHQEITELLPWYVNGTLDQRNTSLVRQHLEECADCQSDYRFLSKVDSAVNKSSPTAIVPTPPIDSFLRKLDAENREHEPRKSYISRPVFKMAMAASIVIAALIVTSIAGNWRSATEVPTQFRTVTSAPARVDVDFVLRVQFHSETSHVERGRILESLNASDVVENLDSNTVRLVASVPGSSLTDVEKFTTNLEADERIISVEAIAIQLPVRNQ